MFKTAKSIVFIMILEFPIGRLFDIKTIYEMVGMS